MAHLARPSRARIAVVAASAAAGLVAALLVHGASGSGLAAAAAPAPVTTIAVTDAPDGVTATRHAVDHAQPDMTTAAAPAARVVPRPASASRLASTQATRPQPAAGSTATTPPHISFGVYNPGFPGSTASLDQVATAAGRNPDIVMWYVHWGGPWSAFNATDVRTILSRGATPMITWMTDDPTASSPVAALSPRAIAKGSQDAYIRAWATGLRSVPGIVDIRLDHEMNGNWYTWSPGQNGVTSADYVAMWRHVHHVFSSLGVTNVRWVWSPNVEWSAGPGYAGSTPLAGLYPGDSYVDMVGLDGYNWGTLNGKTWQSFDQIFDSSISDVHGLTARPFLITEIASTSVGGDKAAWITDFLATLLTRPDITGFVWFDAVKETDWRFDETSTTASAFAAGLLRFS